MIFQHHDANLEGSSAQTSIEELLRQLVEEADTPFEALFDAAPDAIVIANSDGSIRLVNQQTAHLFGYTADELIGQPVESLLPESLRALHRKHRARYMTEPRTRPMGAGLELQAIRKDGTTFPVEISLSPLQSAKGLLVTAIIRDISRRKRDEQDRQRLLEQAESARAEAERTAERLRRLQTITDRSLAHLNLDKLLNELLERVQALLDVDEVVILLLDPEREVLVPRAATGAAGPASFGVDVPVGLGFAGRVASERKAIAIVDVSEVALVNPRLHEIGLRSLLGVPLLVEGRLLGVVHVGSFENRQFSVEDTELLQLAADRLALAVDNALLYQAAQQAIQARETFLSIASHELKTPLTTVKGWVHMMVGALRNYDEIDTESLAMFSKELLEQVDRLDLLITDLLDASRIQQGRLDLRPERTDLADLARRVINRFSHTPEYAENHQIAYDGPAQVVGHWDADRLDQVLTNLISNALKYSPQGGEVRVHLHVDGDLVELAISDRGIGIGLAEQAELFQPFSRTAEARRQATGTGLGLYITKQIVELHGGTIDLVSDAGIGTTISIRIPNSRLD